MPADPIPGEPGPAVRLVPVPASQADEVLAGWLPDDDPPLRATRGWPTAGTAIGLGYAAHGGRSWLVVVDGAVIGDLGTKGPPDAAGSVEIGYGLAAAHQGRGVGTLAVARLLDELWASPEVCSVTAWVAVDNTASYRLLRRLGFVAGELVDGERCYRLDHPR